MSKQSLGVLVRKLRKGKDLSHRKLEKLMKKIDPENAVSYVSLVHIENGRFNTNRETLSLIAKALDYNIDALLAESEQVKDDVAEVIKEKADIIPDFLRSAKNLSESDWEKLSKMVIKMSTNND
ncbi:MAG: helix-turn-helix transcriptional regulator [Candidatus Marinimicrobia bacterium]|nr:helix-turn-helix transcriptional regulator [Candidatus Neomarinimicrobiota bacterium]